MSRRRYVSTDISTDARFNRLALSDGGDFAALFYMMALPHAGDDARLPTADPDELLMLVCPGRRDKDAADVAAAVAAMLALGLLVEEDGRLGYPPAAFYRYQTYVKHESRRGTPPDAAPTMPAAENAAKRRETPQKAASVPPSFPVPPPLSHPVPVSADADTGAGVREAAAEGDERQATGKPPAYSPAFEAFWRSYPRRERKPAAWAAWCKLAPPRGPTGDLADAVLAGVATWRVSDQWARGIHPHAATWLNGRQWEDEPAPATAAMPARASPNGHRNGKPTTLDLIRATMGATEGADDDRRGARPGHGHVVARLAAPGDGRGDDDGDQSALRRPAGRPG